MPAKEQSSYRIKSVENTLDILEVLSEEPGDIGFSKICSRLGMHKSAVHRLLATLEGRGYVERGHKKGHYRVGLSAYETGQKFISHMDLLNKAKPAMEDLALKFNESIYLVVPCKEDILLLNKVQTRQKIQIMPMVGKHFPYAQFSAGRIIEAFGGESLDVNEELGQLKEQGVCIDRGKLSEGVSSISVPLLSADGIAIGSLCLIAPDFRMTNEIVDKFVPRIIAAGREVSVKLGYLGHYLR